MSGYEEILYSTKLLYSLVYRSTIKVYQIQITCSNQPYKVIWLGLLCNLLVDNTNMEAVIFLNTKCTDKTYAQLVAVLNTLIKVNILPNYSFQDNCIL